MRSAIRILTLSLCTLALFAQQRGGPPQPEWARQARQLITAGQLDDALAVYQKELAASTDNPQLNNATGVLLDLMAKGPDARKYFSKNIDLAKDNTAKVGTLRAMALSYAFESDCKNGLKYEQMAYDIRKSENDYYQQGEVANEAARICIDAGDLNEAQKWYKLGYDSGIKDPKLPPDMKDLWEFRWENAQARIAARRGNKAEALKHVAAAKALYEKDPQMGSTSGQEQGSYVPYLVGYVALYTGDYKTALEELQKAQQGDPFIQCLLGQTYEKLGEKDKAMECYRKAAATTGHNPPAAFSRPFAKKKLA
jgi:tetratricopeptide (TPR) repeat protein